MEHVHLFVGICWLVFLLVWFSAALSAKRSVRTGRSAFGLLRLAIFIGVLCLSHIHIGLAEGTQNLVFGTFGAALCAGGIAFAIWARFHIGRNWGAPMSIKQDPELVSSGPYSFVRHPIYSGILLAFVGTIIVQGLIWLIPFSLSTAYFIYSARTEEKNMNGMFPDDYPAYKARTKMLIPYLL